MALQNSSEATPLILLDEIDNMGGEKQYDPMGPLYALLEDSTAKQFKDEMIEVPVDCSAINWIGTANNLGPIPEPILSRFVIPNVSEPNKAEMKDITQSIYKDIVDDNDAWGKFFCDNLSTEITDKLVGIAPRKIKQLLIDGCGRAAQRMKDDETDQLIISNDNIEIAYAKGKASIGFLN